MASSTVKHNRGLAWLATAASPFVLYACIKSALMQLGAGAAVAAAGLPPADLSPMMEQAMKTARVPSSPVTDDLLQLTNNAISTNPLAYEPFFIHGRAAEQAGDTQRALILLEEARRRRPSSRATRLTLLTYYVKTQRFDAALAELDALLRSDEALGRALLPELAKLVSDDRGREELATILASEPEWRENFLQVLTDRKVKPAEARALYEAVRKKKARGKLDLERQALFQSYVSWGQYRQGRAEWRRSLRPDLREANANVFDGSFRGMKAPQPFVWSLSDTSAGRAEIARNSASSYLAVSFFGAAEAVLAEQILALPSGGHNLSTRASSESGVKAGRIYWRVTCLPGAREIAVLDLSTAQSQPRRFTSAFSVPESGCEGQKLSLLAEPGDVTSASELKLHSVEIR